MHILCTFVSIVAAATVGTTLTAYYLLAVLMRIVLVPAVRTIVIAARRTALNAGMIVKIVSTSTVLSLVLMRTVPATAVGTTVIAAQRTALNAGIP